MHHSAKTRTSYNSCNNHSLPCRKFSVTTTNPRNFSFVQNKRSTNASCCCFYAKVRNLSKFKCYMRDTL